MDTADSPVLDKLKALDVADRWDALRHVVEREVADMTVPAAATTGAPAAPQPETSARTLPEVLWRLERLLGRALPIPEESWHPSPANLMNYLTKAVLPDLFPSSDWRPVLSTGTLWDTILTQVRLDPPDQPERKSRR